jgi:hypothetical protein
MLEFAYVLAVVCVSLVPSTPPMVNTSFGPLIGLEIEAGEMFVGIPYALVSGKVVEPKHAVLIFHRLTPHRCCTVEAAVVQEEYF